MGAIRFQVHPPRVLDQLRDVEVAYFTGVDMAPWPVRLEIEADRLVCYRDTSDSGALHIAWPVPGFGRPVLSTATLAERPEPYLLSVELARGKLYQIRSQLTDWEAAGISIPRDHVDRLRQAEAHFYRAANCQHDPPSSAEPAEQALVLAVDLAERMADAYQKHMLEIQHRDYPHLATLLGCQLDSVAPAEPWEQWYRQAFNFVSVPLRWRQIEPGEGQYDWSVMDRQVRWARKHRLVLRGGPLVVLSSQALPDWLWLWEKDFGNLLCFMSDYVETVLTRYQGRIRMWELTARTNSASTLALSEDQRLRLTLRILEVARQVDPDALYSIRIGQPWGEYLAQSQQNLSPLHFANTLVRTQMGLAGIDLEMVFGYQGEGVWPRDRLEISRFLDLWSCLGVPLHLTLAAPSSEEPDPKADPDVPVAAGAWRRPWSEAAQAEWIEQHLPLMLAKPMVQSVTWCHLSDAEPHQFPHAGLLRADGIPKPALETLIRLRREHLK